MNPIKHVYCRAVQFVLRTALPFLPYREPEIFRSCGELKTVFQKEGIRRVLVVTDSGIVGSGIAYTTYADTRPNPTVENVEQALALYRENQRQRNGLRRSR